jgi:hypothetical protein
MPKAAWTVSRMQASTRMRVEGVAAAKKAAAEREREGADDAADAAKAARTPETSVHAQPAAKAQLYASR